MPKFYEFFAGAGLVRLALEPPWRCVWANDIDPSKQAIYTKNFGDDEFFLGDVSTIQVGTLPGNADMAWASFPCQDLSLAGWRKGMDARRSGTFWAFWRIMRDLVASRDRPPIIVIENVPGLLNSPDFSGLCEALASLGMQFGALVIDARHFLPQSRQRVFIVAVDADVDCSSLVTKQAVGEAWYPKALKNAVSKLPTQVCPLWRWWTLPLPSTPVPLLLDLIEEEPTTVKLNSPAETQRLLDMMTENNMAKLDAARNALFPAIGLLYKRTREGRQRAEIRFDNIAGCLRTPKGGSSRQTVLIIQDGQVKSRLLSPREAARLMGAPDDYMLLDGYNDSYRAMGDGVAVPVVRHLSRHLLLPLIDLCANTTDSIRGDLPAIQSGHLAQTLRSSDARADGWHAAAPRKP